jgi:hypothetical protein
MINISKSSFIEKTLKNEQGIALILVLGVITILTFLLADFTFETKLNKIKIYNQQDKIQARLNAEAGLNFSLAKLRMYQEGRNKIEKDENLKSAFPTSDLESIIIQPFVFPPPVSSKANIIQRSAANEFLKKIIFRGEVSVVISKVSGFLNPNGLRIQPKITTAGIDPEDGTPTPSTIETDGKNPAQDEDKTPPQPAWVVIEKKMIETLELLLKEKNDSDEIFHLHYANTDASYLIKELRYYVSDKGTFQDSLKGGIEAKFDEKKITPKFSPMTSIDELYLLPSWDDAIVDLIKDRMSVHEVSIIAINELTLQDLKILFPAINNIQIEEFFKYRDGDEDKKIKGKKFKDAEDFKRVVVSELNIVSDSDYLERINSLKNAGLVIDTAGKLYKVNSRGVMNNAVYNLIAYIDLPIKPRPKQPKAPGQTPPGADPTPGTETGQPEETPPPGQKEKPVPVELLLPRVVEIRLE